MTRLDKAAVESVKCDVVVVNYNAGDFLSRTVKSVFSSDIPVSLTIVDNASIDDSIEQIKKIKPREHTIRIVQNANNLGFSKGVNLGAETGSAPFVFLLNPDCEVHPHTIRRLIEEAERYEDCGIMGPLVFNEDGTEQRGCRRLEPTFMRSVVTAMRLDKYFKSVNLQFDELPPEPVTIDAVSGSAMLVDRITFEAIGGMDEGYFLHVEDLDFCRRVREHGKKIYFTPHVSLFHHHGASSHHIPVHTEWHKHQGMLRYQGKFQEPNQSAVRSFLTRGVIYLHFGLSVLRKKLARKTSNGRAIQSLVAATRDSTILTGASSDLGKALLLEFKNEPAVIAVSRSSQFPAQIGNEVWMNWSFFEKVPSADFGSIKTWMALSPVWSAPEMAAVLSRFGAIPRVVAVSSTSVMGKASSANAKEMNVVQMLKQGEKDLIEWAEQAGSNATIARSSMIYGGNKNQNIAFIKRVIIWFRFFPMLSRGDGLRQPVHLHDLATALSRIEDRNDLPDQIYNLAGGEQLSYHDMVKRVFRSLNRTPRFKILPEAVFKRIADICAYIPGLKFINREMITRMEQDLVYDIEPATRDFDYSPGDFRP